MSNFLKNFISVHFVKLLFLFMYFTFGKFFKTCFLFFFSFPSKTNVPFFPPFLSLLETPILFPFIFLLIFWMDQLVRWINRFFFSSHFFSKFVFWTTFWYTYNKTYQKYYFENFHNGKGREMQVFFFINV